MAKKRVEPTPLEADQSKAAAGVKDQKVGDEGTSQASEPTPTVPAPETTEAPTAVAPTGEVLPAVVVPTSEASTATVAQPDTLEELERLEDVYRKGHKDAIMALREIRERRLFRHRYDEGGNPYKSFDAYMENVWHKTRQWATQEINWLRACELIEEKTGKEPYQLTKKSANEFKRLIEHPDELVRAYLEAREAVGTYKNIDGKTANKIVTRRKRYIALRREWADAEGDKADFQAVQYKEFLALDALPRNRAWKSERLIQEARNRTAGGADLKDCLYDACKDHEEFPNDKDLLRLFRCEALEEAVVPLIGLHMEIEHREKIKEATEKVQSEIAKYKPAPQTVVDSGRVLRSPEFYDSEEAAFEAVDKVVGYLWNTERERYAQADDTQRQGHIFLSLCELRRWLSGMDNSIEDWMKVVA